MPSSPVQVGFIGTGGIARWHISHLKEIPECRIAALCDVDAARVKTVADPLGAAVYTDAAKLIAEAKLDALYVCVPPFAHGDIEIRAAQRGLHMFIEKPVNLCVDSGRKALDAIKKAGVMTQSGYSLRYMASSMRLKEFLKDKTVGTAHVFRWGGLPEVPWWRKYDQAGGQLVEMTTHQVDLLRWVMGEVQAVSASYSFGRVFKDNPDVTVPDSQAVLLHFKSGASATINTSCGSGKGGMNQVDFVIRDAKVQWKGENLTVDPEGTYPLPPAPTETPSIDAAFIRGIASGNAAMMKSPYEDALRTAAVTIAANRSAEAGGRLVAMEELLGAL
jgi:predicted dehydrogenase